MKAIKFSQMSTERLRGIIIQRLEEKNLSYSRAESLAGIGNGVISRIMSGERGIGPEVATALAGVLGVAPEVIYRAAGLLPEKPNDERYDNLCFIISQLGELDQRDVLDYARMKLEKAQQRDRLQDLRDSLKNVQENQSIEARQLIWDFMKEMGWQVEKKS